jgi:hypothetical protein
MVTEDLRRAGGTVDGGTVNGRRRAVPATDRHVSDLTTQLGEQVTRLIRAETASREESAELDELRTEADRAAHEAAETLAELATRVAEAGNPRALARRATGGVGRGTGQMARGVRRKMVTMTGTIADQRGATRIVLVALPVLAVLAGAAVAYRRATRGERA